MLWIGVLPAILTACGNGVFDNVGALPTHPGYTFGDFREFVHYDLCCGHGSFDDELNWIVVAWCYLPRPCLRTFAMTVPKEFQTDAAAGAPANKKHITIMTAFLYILMSVLFGWLKFIKQSSHL